MITIKVSSDAILRKTVESVEPNDFISLSVKLCLALVN